MRSKSNQSGFVQVAMLLLVPAVIVLVLYVGGGAIVDAYYRTVEHQCLFGYSDGSVDCQAKRWTGMKFQPRKMDEPISLPPFPTVKKKSKDAGAAFECMDLAFDKKLERKEEKSRICLVETLYAAALTYNRNLNELKYYANFPNSDAHTQSKESKDVSGQVYDVLLKALERSEHDWLVPITIAGVKTTPDVIRETILPKTVAMKMNWSADIAARGASYKFLSAQLIRQRTEKW